MVAHQVVHDRRGAGQRTDRDVDWSSRFQTANEFVVVDDRDHVCAVDVGRQFCRVVGVNDHDGLAVCHVCDDLRQIKTPACRHKPRFCVWCAQKPCFGCVAGVVHEPFPDQRRAEGISVGRFVPKNQSCHCFIPLNQGGFKRLIKGNAMAVTLQIAHGWYGA